MLTVIVTISALFLLGFTNPRTGLSESCIFPAQIGCRAYAMNTSGNLALDIGQDTGHDITIFAIKCTQQPNPSLDAVAFTITIANGDHALITTSAVRCYKLDEAGEPVVAAGAAGSVYKGKVYIQYNERDSGFMHVVVGDVTLKYGDVVLPEAAP